jgi:hypothetical protein
MATAPYRQFWKATSNVSEDRRIIGTFAMTAAASHWTLGSFVRPSAGSAATSGQGNNFTVTQPGGQDTPFLVTPLENIVQPVAIMAEVILVPTDATAAATAPVLTAATYAGVQASQYNATTGTFWLCPVDTVGKALPAATAPPTGYTWLVQFELIIKPTFVPASV